MFVCLVRMIWYEISSCCWSFRCKCMIRCMTRMIWIKFSWCGNWFLVLRLVRIIWCTMSNFCRNIRYKCLNGWITRIMWIGWCWCVKWCLIGMNVWWWQWVACLFRIFGSGFQTGINNRCIIRIRWIGHCWECKILHLCQFFEGCGILNSLFLQCLL